MTACLASLLAATALAAAPAMRCREGQTPYLTGSPLTLLDCAAKAPAGTAPAPSAPLPEAADKERADLKALEGTWRGAANVAGAFYDFELQARGKTLSWTRLDLRFHERLRLDVELKQGLFSKRQPFGAVARSPQAPGAELAAQVWLGAAPLEDGKRPARDRLAVWVFEGRAGEHRLEFAVRGDELDGLYVHVASGAPTGFPLKLKRAR